MATADPTRDHPDGERSGRGRRPVRWGRLAVFGGGLLLAANLAVLGTISHQTDPGPPDLPADVFELFPAPGSQALRQTEIFAALDASFTGELAIDGRPIPADETEVRPQGPTVRVSFTPGDGKVIEELEPDLHTVTVTWWPDTGQVDDRPEAERTGRIQEYSWQFKAN